MTIIFTTGTCPLLLCSDNEVVQKIHIIETEEKNVLKRASAIVSMLEDLFGRLKEFITGYIFANEGEDRFELFGLGMHACRKKGAK